MEQTHTFALPGNTHLSTKLCPACRRELPLDAFHRDMSRRDRHARRCKTCAIIAAQLSRVSTKRDAWLTRRYERFLENAAKREKVVAIGAETYKDYVVRPCFYCGDPTGDGVGLDRIDNDRGYELGNVVPCCGICNMTRGNRWSFRLFIKFIAPAIRLAKKDIRGEDIPETSSLEAARADLVREIQDARVAREARHHAGRSDGTADVCVEPPAEGVPPDAGEAGVRNVVDGDIRGGVLQRKGPAA